MRKISLKRAKALEEYKKVQQEIYEERPRCCQGCGRTDVRLTFSHLIPRNRPATCKLSDKRNIHLHCRECHSICEEGRWHLLADGEEIAEYVEENDYEYYEIKMEFYEPENMVIQIRYESPKDQW